MNSLCLCSRSLLVRAGSWCIQDFSFKSPSFFNNKFLLSSPVFFIKSLLAWTTSSTRVLATYGSTTSSLPFSSNSPFNKLALLSSALSSNFPFFWPYCFAFSSAILYCRLVESSRSVAASSLFSNLTNPVPLWVWVSSPCTLQSKAYLTFPNCSINSLNCSYVVSHPMFLTKRVSLQSFFSFWAR